MPERLLIRLHADGALSWLGLDAAGRAMGASRPGAPPAAVIAAAQRITVLVPAHEVVLVQTSRLPGTRAQWHRALPFALEERLAAPVEDLHFAAHADASRDALRVAVVARQRMDAWHTLLRDAGIRPDAMHAQSEALPLRAHGTCAIIDDCHAAWRRDDAQAGGCDVEQLAQWLEVVAGAQASAVEIDDFRDADPLPLANSAYHPRQPDVLAFFAAHLGDAAAIDLLQGDYAATHRRAPARRLWRNAALLAASAVVLTFALCGLDRWRLARQSAQLDGAARAILHATFPRLDHVAGDPRQLMESALRGASGAGGGSGLMHLLGRIAPVLSNGSRSVLTGIEYHNATLELALRSPDVQTLDLLRESLATLPGIKVEVSAANAGSQGIEGRLRIAGAAP